MPTVGVDTCCSLALAGLTAIFAFDLTSRQAIRRSGSYRRRKSTCLDIGCVRRISSRPSLQEVRQRRSNIWNASSTAEVRILELHQAEAELRGPFADQLLTELADLLDVVPDAAVPRIRAALDGGLVFDLQGRHVDLRRLVLELSDEDRQRVLARIHGACQPPSAALPGFVVLSDVDDTVLPGRDLLRISGCDRSWVLDGRLYPGVAHLHTELRGHLGRDRDYPVLLTARPPPLVRKLPDRLAELTDDRRPRMAILPGVSGVTNVGANFVRILCHNYSRLAGMKVTRVEEYAVLFPDYAGRFVFIGDDGQGDLAASARLLELQEPRLERGEWVCRRPSRSRILGPLRNAVASSASLASLVNTLDDDDDDDDEPKLLLAFIAIHAVRDKAGGFCVSQKRRDAKVYELRRRFPALDGRRHRFFYFADYTDLARQLAYAGWLEPRQSEAVAEAVRTANDAGSHEQRGSP